MDSSVVHLWRRLQTLAKLFRFVELLTLLVLLTWISTRLPFAVKISGEYCRFFVTLVFSPTSVFVLGNAIVVTLLAKSGLFSSADVSSSDVDDVVSELYRKLRESDSESESESERRMKTETTPLEVVFEDKEVIVCEEKTERKSASYRRSKSEKVKSEYTDTDTVKLRRSETDVCRKYLIYGGGDKSTVKLTAEDEGGEGGEEFRRTIEEFIAKQVKFHREESLAVVLHGKA